MFVVFCISEIKSNSFCCFYIIGCSTGCEVPHLENGYFTLRTAQGRRLQQSTCASVNEYIYANCQQGLTRRGSYYLRCEHSGEWFKEHGDDATCKFKF